MRMPGFTAESSICVRHGKYLDTLTAVQMDKSVQPAYTRNCMSKCMSQMGDDPFAEHNCRCICYGRPGHNCWPI